MAYGLKASSCNPLRKKTFMNMMKKFKNFIFQSSWPSLHQRAN